MEILYAIAEYIQCPNEWIILGTFRDGYLYFTVKGLGTRYYCKLNKAQSRMIKNSIRIDHS